MIQTVEAVVDADGRVRLLGELRLEGSRRALVTILDEPAAVPGESALLAAARLRPTDPEPHRLLAGLYQETGRAEEAQREMERLKELTKGP